MPVEPLPIKSDAAPAVEAVPTSAAVANVISPPLVSPLALTVRVPKAPLPPVVAVPIAPLKSTVPAPLTIVRLLASVAFESSVELKSTVPPPEVSV